MREPVRPTAMTDEPLSPDAYRERPEMALFSKTLTALARYVERADA